jgi:hypothetical protein
VSQNFCRFFRHLPQGTRNLHSFRTAELQILIAERSRMREIAITASVNETLPVIAKVGSAAVVLTGKIGASCKASTDQAQRDVLPSGSQT